MTLAHNWPKTVMSSWHTKRLWSFLRFYQTETICQKIDINVAPTGQLWLLSFFLPSSRRETAYANVYFLNRLFSIKTHSGQRIQRQVFRWRVKISFMVSVVEADGTNVGESRGATLWLLQSLARQHWMLNRLGGMGIGEEEMEGTIPVVPCKIFWGRH